MREIPDETYARAGAVMRGALGGAPDEGVEVMPGFDLMVAGAAMSLSEAAPGVFYDAARSTPKDYLTEGRAEWRHLHSAVARVIDLHGQDRHYFETSGDVMHHMVSDVMHQARARRIDLAIENSDPAFMTMLSNASRDTVHYARQDPEVAALVKAESIGAYHRFDDYTRSDIATSVVNGEYSTEPLRKALAVAERGVDAHGDELPRVQEARDRALGDAADFGVELFPTPDERQRRLAIELVDGVRTPSGAIEIAIVAHAALAEQDEKARSAPDREAAAADRMAAYARAIADGDRANGEWPSAGTVAARIEADVGAVARIRRDAGAALDAAETPHEISLAYQGGLEGGASGDPSRLDPQAKASTFAAIRDLEGVSALRHVDLMFGVEAVERGELMVEKAFEAKRAAEARVITYEGDNVVDLQEHEERWRRSLYLPGDRVRVNEGVKVSGVDADALRTKLGDEPLTVAGAFVRGETRSDAMGGTRDVVLTQYEFVGHEGSRYPSMQFQHERGDEHRYGAMVVKDDRLWFVPLSEDMDKPAAIGPAREVTALDAFEGVESLADAKSVFSDAASGEFVMRPETFGAGRGPIELVAAPWMSGLSSAETDIAFTAVERETSSVAVTAARAAAMSQGAAR